MFFDTNQGKQLLRERKKKNAEENNNKKSIIQKEGFINNDGKKTDEDDDTKLVNELTVLEDDFNTKKSAYALAYKSLMDKTQNYMASADNTNTKINKNVYVNQVQNPTTITPSRVGCYRTNATFETDEYIGTYTDSWTRAMPQTTGTYIPYADCRAAAVKGNYKYYAVQNYQASNNTAQCFFSNDLTQAEAQGPSSAIITGSDGRKYGGPWGNAIYTIGTSVEDDTTTGMTYQTDLGTSVSSDACKTRAGDLGNSVFALRGGNSAAGISKCYVGNNLTAATQGGIATKTMVSYSFDQVPNVNMAELFYNGQVGVYKDTPTVNISLDSRFKGVSTCNLLTGGLINTSKMIASWGLGCPPVPPVPPTPPSPILIGVGTDNKLYSKTSINKPWTKLPDSYGNGNGKTYITVGGQIGVGGPLMLIGTDNQVWTKVFFESDSLQNTGPYGIQGGIIWLNNYGAFYAIGGNNAAWSAWNDLQSWEQFNNGGRLLGVILLNDGVSFLGIGMDNTLFTAANQWSYWVQVPGNTCCMISVAQLPDDSFIAVGTDNKLYTKKSLNATDTWVKVTTTEPIGMISIGTYTVNPADPLFKAPPPPQGQLTPPPPGTITTPQAAFAYLEMLKIQNIEKKADLKAEIASLAVGNWNTYTSVVKGQESADFIVGQAGSDPAPYCQKDFSATYKCGLGPNKTITIAAEAKGKTAQFDCTAENAICKGFKLTLGDDGNLVLTDSTKKVVWQSNTKTVGIASTEFNAANGIYGRNYLNPGETLGAGQFIGSPSGNCFLIMIAGSDTTPGGLQIQYNIVNCSATSGAGNDDTAYGVYNIPGVVSSAIASGLGQAGFIDDSGTLREYPSEMIHLGTDYDSLGNYNSEGNDLSSFTMTNISSADCKAKCSATEKCAGFIFNKSENKCYLKSSGMFPTGLRIPDSNSELYIRSKTVSGGDISCPTTMDKGISVAEWSAMPIGEKMQMTTLCKLGLVTQTDQQDLKAKNQAVSLAAAKLQAKIDELVENDMLLVNKLGNHVNKLQKDLKQYTIVNKEISKNENTMEGLTGFSDDSELVMISNNYRYLLLTIFAIFLVGTIIKVSRR